MSRPRGWRCFRRTPRNRLGSGFPSHRLYEWPKPLGRRSSAPYRLQPRRWKPRTMQRIHRLRNGKYERFDRRRFRHQGRCGFEEQWRWTWCPMRQKVQILYRTSRRPAVQGIAPSDRRPGHRRLPWLPSWLDAWLRWVESPCPNEGQPGQRGIRACHDLVPLLHQGVA